MNRYDMYCPIARALDVLGDRWTLLVLRELNMGERRFTDLKNNLPGVPPNVLSSRLKALTDEGLVTTRELPPPAARTVYTVTDRGRETAPILRSLVRFGMTDLDDAGPDIEVRPAMVVHAALTPYYDRDAANGVADTYRLVIGGEEHWLSATPGVRPDGGDADLELEGPAWAFVAARQGIRTLSRSIDEGIIAMRGPKRALRDFERVFALSR